MEDKEKRKQKIKKNSSKEKNTCIVCGRDIKKGHKICSRCLKIIQDNNNTHEKNRYVEDISDEFLKELSNSYNHYEKKVDKETGIKYIEEHPEKRAEDLKEAFRNPEIKGILCAIGGIDGYKIFPYLMEDEEFKKIVLENPKIFTGTF